MRACSPTFANTSPGELWHSRSAQTAPAARAGTVEQAAAQSDQPKRLPASSTEESQ